LITKREYDMKKFFFGMIASLILGTSSVFAGSYNGIVAFGDSLSDPGNVFAFTGWQSVRPFSADNIPSAPYARGGHHFSNGSTWIEQLSADLKLKEGTGPALRNSAFTNYAFGAARARDSGSPFDLTQQVTQFLSSGQAITPDTLISLYVGGNDVRDALVAFNAAFMETLASGGTMGDAQAAGEAAAGLILTPAITAIADNIVMLAMEGGIQFLVPNLPDIGLAPAVQALGPQAAFVASQLSVQFNAVLESTLQGLESFVGIHVTRLNVYQLINDVVNDPGVAGLVNATDACITPLVRKGAFCNQPDDYLFWDGIHPTRAGHAYLADAALELLTP
jgi:phospholipase/lecithinase/hemolysin